MSDRYSRRYDAQDDRYDNDDSYNSSHRRHYSAHESRYGGNADTRRGRYADSYAPADPYADDMYDAYDSYGSASSASRRRSSRAEDGQRRRSANLFSDYFTEEDIDAFRRSAYTTERNSTSRTYQRASRGTGAYRDDAGYDGWRDYEGQPARSSRQSNTRRAASTYSRSTVGHGEGPYAYEDPYAYEEAGESYSERLKRGSRRSTPTPHRSSGNRQAQNRAGGPDGYEADSYDYPADVEDLAVAPKKSNVKRNVIIAVVTVLAVLAIGAGMAFAYFNSIAQNLHEDVDEDLMDALVPTTMGDKPFYMLLLGTDGSKDRYDDEDFGETPRSDSMMLARIDPVNKKVALISIHRDTIVDLGPEYGEQKINAAYQLYGAAGAVRTVSQMAGVDISHYASVDFDGFSAIVDALGGVEVEVPMEIDDEMAGGYVPEGWQTLDGEHALILCRSRHSYDDVASDGDVMRAANQRMVISAIAKKILASDILTIANTVRTMSQYVTTDLALTDIIGLAQIMQGIDPETDIYTAMEPTTSEYFEDDGWYEYLDEEEWSRMIARMDQGLPPVEETVVDDATGTVLSTAGGASSSNAATSSSKASSSSSS